MASGLLLRHSARQSRNPGTPGSERSTGISGCCDYAQHDMGGAQHDGRRPGKGAHRAVDYQRQARRYPYVLKVDIARYFPQSTAPFRAGSCAVSMTDSGHLHKNRVSNKYRLEQI